MNYSAANPRAALMARARRHFVAIAATSAVLTGGLTAYTAAATATPAGQVDPSEAPEGSRGDVHLDSSSPVGGLSGPADHAAPDASSNAS